MSGFTQIKNKSDSTYVKDDVYVAWHRAVKHSLAGTVASVRHNPSPQSMHKAPWVQWMGSTLGTKRFISLL